MNSVTTKQQLEVVIRAKRSGLIAGSSKSQYYRVNNILLRESLSEFSYE